MANRLGALVERVGEAQRLGATPRSKLAYLAAHYWARLGAHTPFELPPLEVQVDVPAEGRTLRALVRANNSDWGILRGIFLQREYAISPAPEGIRRIVDLGGNCGYASLFFSVAYPDAEIVALEPMPENADVCRRNFALNQIRGELIEAAIAREDGTAELLLTDNEGCQSLVDLHAWSRKLKVQTVSIPSLLKQRGWYGIDLLKMDIEGYEKVLLEGSPSWLGRVGTLIGELHGDYGQKELARDLAPYHFEIETLSAGYETTFVARRRL